MIGNLFLAIGLACGLGAVALGNQNPSYAVDNYRGGLMVSQKSTSLDVEDAYTINITNLLFNPIKEFDLSALPSTQYNGDIVLVDSNGSTTLSYTGYPNQFEDSLTSTNATGIYQYYAGFRYNTSIDSGIYWTNFDFKSVNSSFAWDNISYVIDALEMTPTISVYDSNDNLLSQDSNLIYLRYNNTLLSFNDGQYFAMTSHNLIGLSTSTDYLNFGSIDIGFKTSEINAIDGASYFQLGFKGYWCCNYLNNASFGFGFDTGYSQGLTEGYANGYREGLSTAQGGDFNSLFNSVADSPLRFLYGLFNFDLFGTSMIIIILSLLTGIILFGIIKKFWK